MSPHLPTQHLLGNDIIQRFTKERSAQVILQTTSHYLTKRKKKTNLKKVQLQCIQANFFICLTWGKDPINLACMLVNPKHMTTFGKWILMCSSLILCLIVNDQTEMQVLYSIHVEEWEITVHVPVFDTSCHHTLRFGTKRSRQLRRKQEWCETWTHGAVMHVCVGEYVKQIRPQKYSLQWEVCSSEYLSLCASQQPSHISTLVGVHSWYVHVEDIFHP